LDRLAKELHASYGVDITVMTADFTKRAEISKVEKQIQKLNHLDMLVNNAGYSNLGKFAEYPIKSYLDMIGLRDLASVHLRHSALPGMFVHNFQFTFVKSS
jgi:short-subunit dehydrogenase